MGLAVRLRLSEGVGEVGGMKGGEGAQGRPIELEPEMEIQVIGARAAEVPSMTGVSRRGGGIDQPLQASGASALISPHTSTHIGWFLRECEPLS